MDFTIENIFEKIAKWEPKVKKLLAKDKYIWKRWADDYTDIISRIYWVIFNNLKRKAAIKFGLKVPIPLQGKAPAITAWTEKTATENDWAIFFLDFILGRSWGDKTIRNFKKLGIFDESVPYSSKNKFTGFRTLNVGFLTEKCGIEIDDIDTKNGGKGLESHILLCKVAGIDREEYLRSTLFVKSGSGNGAGHLYNRMPLGHSAFGTIDTGKYPQLDILFAGKQVVSAFSKHPSGGFYEIELTENEPFPIDTFGFERINPIPTEILKVLEKVCGVGASCYDEKTTKKPKITKKITGQVKPVKKNAGETPEAIIEEDGEEEEVKIEFDTEEQKPQAIKELVAKLDQRYRRTFGFDLKRKLQWALSNCGNTDEHQAIYQDMWDRQKGETKNTKGWHNAAEVIRGFDPSKHKGDGLDYVLKEMRWIYLPPDMKPAHKLRAIKEKEALVDSWVAKWLPARIEIKEYDEIYNKKFVKDLPIDQETILIKSHCGTGKSTAIRNLMKKIQASLGRPIRIVYFCNRKSYGFNTIQELRKELGEDFVLYSDTPDFYKHEKILVEIESLHRMQEIVEQLKESGNKIDIIAFDECESGLKQWTSHTVMKKWRGNTFTLQGLMEVGERVVFADSFLSQRTEEFVKNTRPGGNMHKIHNTRKLVKKQLRIIDEEGRLYAIIEDRIERGENWFGVIPEKGMAIRIHNQLVAKFGDVGCLYHGETNNKEELMNVNENWVKYRWSIQTLTNTVGIDFNVKGHFNGVFVFASNKQCGLARDLIQSILRVRHLKDNLIYICIKDIKVRPKYGYTLKAINFNIKRIERRNQELLELLNKPYTPKQFSEYVKEFNSIASEEFKQFQREWSQFLDTNGVPLNITLKDKPPKFLEDLQLYHYHEEAQNSGRYTETLMGYLAEINCHIVDDKTLDNDYNLGIDIIQKEKRKEVVPIGDVPNMEETRAHALAKYLSLNERLGDMNFDEHQGWATYPEALKAKMEINMENWLKYRKRLDTIMLGRTKDFWDDEERLSYEKYCFLKIFNYDPEDVEFVKIWEKWNNNQTFKKCTYVTIEIVNTLKKYELAKEKGFYKGEWEDFFNLHSFIKRDYYTIMGEKHLHRKWAIKLLKMIASINGEPEGSLINKLMGDGEISFDLLQKDQIVDFIKKNETIITEELGLGIREKSDEGKWIHSNDKINYAISFILKQYLGLKLGLVQKREYVKERRTVKGKRRTINVRVWTTIGHRLVFISPFSLLKTWEDKN